MDAFCPQKGVDHAVDHICDFLNFVVAGVGQWLHDGWSHTHFAGRCHHRVSDPTYSGTKDIVAILTPAGEGEVLGKGVVSKLEKIFAESCYDTFVRKVW